VARQKEFDPDDALDRAMRLFWERGYEKTSMQDLVERMGVHKRSMYDTFGDKHTLYVRALDRYIGAAEQDQLVAVEQATGARDAIRALFASAVNHGSKQPRGCFAVNSAAETALADPQVAGCVRRLFAGSERLLLELVTLAQQTGEASPQHDPEVLAAALHNAWIGLRVQARAGLGKTKLSAMVDGMLAMLD
jgi:TetR/AcrR family transcriptional regulator, transcriptional repressor for nem operon